MKIAIASDHAGFAYKQQLVEYLRSRGHLVTDFGTHSPDSMDYPEPPKQYETTAIVELLESRYFACRSTVFCSRHTWQNLGDLLPDAYFDVLRARPLWLAELQ